MPPVVSIVGKSKSGKTTLMEGLIRELKSRGYRVATIKHTPQGMTFAEPDKDSWRHVQAGSEVTAISSPDRVVLIKPVTQALTLDEVAHLVGEDCDIILAEGFKQDNAPKIEVHRREVGSPLSAVRKLIAVAADEPLETKVRQFSLQDIKEGISLQLPVYAIALREIFHIEPLAIEIYSLADGKRRGVYNEAARDSIPTLRKTSTLSQDEFLQLLEGTERFIANYAHEIRQGKISIEPENCIYCPYNSICGFEK